VKSNIWDIQGASPSGRTRPKVARRKSIAAILRDAYHQHTRDALSRRAVKKVLR